MSSMMTTGIKEMGRGMAWVEKIQHAMAEGTARPLILFT
jgi:hypothetical protein